MSEQVPSLLTIYDDLAARLPGKVVIAGGAVRDHLMQREPKDFDVFLLRVSREAAEPMIREAMSDATIIAELAWHYLEPYMVGTWRYRGAIVQIMVSPAYSVEALLDTFDWSPCLFAYDGEFHQRTPVEDIAPGKPLFLQQITFPLSTLRRGFRFSERFRMILPHEDILTLCRMVLEKEGSQGPTGAEPDMPSLAAVTLVNERMEEQK